MNQLDLSRRGFLTGHASLLGAMLPALNAELAAADEESCDSLADTRRLKVVCVGAHPDDPESGCAGTLARYAEQGHDVTICYLTRGEAGIRGKSHEEAAAIRTTECEAACNIIGARPVFVGQIDGATEFSRSRIEATTKLLREHEPDILFTHWPIDTHPDHQVASLLTIRAYLSLPRRIPLFFFEVNSGSQTLGFLPNIYVDITVTREKKKAALFAHRSQNGEEIYRKHHEIMETFRGRELGVAAAEAFVQLGRDQRLKLPGL